MRVRSTCPKRFLSTPSGWRATGRFTAMSAAVKISIHALRVEGDCFVVKQFAVSFKISIHALRVEGDVGVPPVHARGVISIHALRVEGDVTDGRCARFDCLISIHALRVEGDSQQDYIHRLRTDFYPRPPGGGRQHTPARNVLTNCISIHALRVEGDPGSSLCRNPVRLFLSTPSGWRATASTAFKPSAPLFLSTPSGWRATQHRVRCNPEC